MTTGQAMRFALQADGSSLATGMYDYSLAVTLTISGVNHTQNFTGKNGNGTFTVTSKIGTVSNFSTLGLLTSVVDSNGNTTTLAYADRNSDGIANELFSVTDPFGRVTNINYTSNKVFSIAHFSGRTTTLSYTGANLTGYTLTDPDGGGPLAAPAVAFAYTSGQLTSRTNPLSQNNQLCLRRQ